MKKKLISLFGAAVILTGCAQAPAPSATGSPAPAATSSATPAPAQAQLEFSDDVKKQAEALVAARENGKFDYKALRLKENGPAWVCLAATSEDPEVVIGGLKGMVGTYTYSPKADKYNLADDTYAMTVLKNLKSDDKKVLFHALKAAHKSMGENPNQEVLDQLLSIATEHSEVGARHEALDAISSARDFAKMESVNEVWVKALADEPAVASLALFRFGYGLARGPKGIALGEIVEGLIAHKDPGVRGRAVQVWSDNYGRDDAKATIAKLEPLLKDENPFVRSMTVRALGGLKDAKTYPLIMSLVDDKEKNTYNIKFQNISGQVDSVHHDGSAWSRVDDAALSSLKSATYSLGDDKFDYQRINYKTVDADIKKEVASAKTWFAAYKKKNPEG